MANEVTYEVVVTIETIGTFGTYREAFTAFYHKVKELIANGGTSAMILNEACWIKASDFPLPWNISTAADRAADQGILDEEGELIED